MILAGIVALIVQAGSGLEAITANRIFPVTLPENVGAAAYTGGFPAIVYKVISVTPDPTFDTSGLQRMRIQFDCYGVGTATASGYAVASGVREALVDLLDGLHGRLPDTSWLEGALLVDYQDGFMNAARQYVAITEFYLLFNRQVVNTSTLPVLFADTVTGTLYRLVVANGATELVTAVSGTPVPVVLHDTVTGANYQLAVAYGALGVAAASSAGLAQLIFTDTANGLAYGLQVTNGALQCIGL